MKHFSGIFHQAQLSIFVKSVQAQVWYIPLLPFLSILERFGSEKGFCLIEIDGHPYFLIASNANAFALCLPFFALPQAQLRGKGHEKRNWKWICDEKLLSFGVLKDFWFYSC